MIDEFNLPKGAVRQYFLTFGLAAVYVATPPTGQPSVIGVTRDLARSASLVRNRWNYEIIIALWAATKSQATWVARLAQNKFGSYRLPDGQFDIRGEHAIGAVRAAAAHCSVTLVNHDAILYRGQAAVQRIDTMLREANATGGLKVFNRAYHRHRLAMKAAGQRQMPYYEAMSLLRRQLLAQLARGMAMSIDEAVIERVFFAASRRANLTTSSTQV